MARTYRLTAAGRRARSERMRDPAVRAKMSAASKRALADPAVRAKMSAASKRAWADPAVRAKMSAASKRALADPAVRAKMSAARKRALADPAVNPLAGLSNHQRKIYSKLRHCGIDRDRALAEARKSHDTERIAA